MNGQVAVSQHEAGAHLVNVVTIDGLSAEFGAPDVLYIDVEGFECEVLKGARRTLEAYTPDCFVEVHLQMGLERYGGSVGMVLSYFPSGVYDLYYCNGEDGLYRQIKTSTVFPHERFYLVALDRKSPVTDRKSTRLNSSHLVISYAVFCLKKKKNKRVYTQLRVEAGGSLACVQILVQLLISKLCRFP